MGRGCSVLRRIASGEFGSSQTFWTKMKNGTMVDPAWVTLGILFGNSARGWGHARVAELPTWSHRTPCMKRFLGLLSIFFFFGLGSADAQDSREILFQSIFRINYGNLSGSMAFSFTQKYRLAFFLQPQSQLKTIWPVRWVANILLACPHLGKYPHLDSLTPSSMFELLLGSVARGLSPSWSHLNG